MESAMQTFKRIYNQTEMQTYAKLFDNFYAKQSLDNKDILDEWLVNLQGLKNMGLMGAKELIIKTINFVSGEVRQ